MNEDQTPAGSVPVNEVVPAPTAPTTQAAPPEFVSIDPLDLLTDSDPTDHYDVATGEVTGTVPVGTKFHAVGKYQTSRSTYYADGRLNIKTTDLKLDPNPTAPAADDDQEQKVEVRVVPKDWRDTFQRSLNRVTYWPKGTFDVHDLAVIQTAFRVNPTVKVVIGGTFKKDGVEYLRAQSSIDKGTWYGFPRDTLQQEEPKDDLEPEDLFDPEEAKASEEAAGYRKNHKVVAAAGTSAGWLNRLRRKKS